MLQLQRRLYMNKEELKQKIFDLENKFWETKNAEIYKFAEGDSTETIIPIEQINRELDSILACDTENPDALKLKIEILLHCKKKADADFYAKKFFEICDKKLELSPGDFNLLMYKLVVLKALDRKSEFKTLGKNILNSFDIKLSTDPDNTDILSQKATVYSLLGDNKNSIKLYKRILELDPANEEARIMIRCESNPYTLKDIFSTIISILILIASIAVYIFM